MHGITLKEVASNLSVDSSAVHRITKKFESCGTISKKAYCSHSRLIKLSKPTIICLVLDNPGIYLWEIQRELSLIFNLEISPAAVWQCLKRSNFSRKKMQLVALQRDYQLRSKYMNDISLYRSNVLVFVDETGCDRRDALRKYGYGLRGHREKSQKLLVRGERVSVIAAMTTNGVLALQVVHGTVTGDVFVEFTQRRLLPCLMDFNGSK